MPIAGGGGLCARLAGPLRWALALGLGVLASLTPAGPVAADEGDLDELAAEVHSGGGVRVTGTGLLGGAPGLLDWPQVHEGEELRHAWLYWAGPEEVDQLLVDGVPVAGEALGTLATACDDEPLFAFRAEAADVVMPGTTSVVVWSAPMPGDLLGMGALLVTGQPGSEEQGTLRAAEGARRLGGASADLAEFDVEEGVFDARLVVLAAGGDGAPDGWLQFDGTPLLADPFSGSDGAAFDALSWALVPGAGARTLSFDPDGESGCAVVLATALLTSSPSTCEDLDGDGQRDVACGGFDCDDADPDVYSGAPELCDGLDGDCDGTVPPEESDLDGDGLSECEGDCGPLNAEVYPGAPDRCDDVDDNDCDGLVDPQESDTDGDLATPCEGDCDDTDPERFTPPPRSAATASTTTVTASSTAPTPTPTPTRTASPPATGTATTATPRSPPACPSSATAATTTATGTSPTTSSTGTWTACRSAPGTATTSAAPSGPGPVVEIVVARALEKDAIGALPGIPVLAPPAGGVTDEHAHPRPALQVQVWAGVELAHVTHRCIAHPASRPHVGTNAPRVPAVPTDHRLTQGGLVESEGVPGIRLGVLVHRWSS